jgi:hypothetical protein
VKADAAVSSVSEILLIVSKGSGSESSGYNGEQTSICAI